MFGTLFKFGADTSQFSKAVMTMPRDVQRARNMINGQVQGMNTAFSALGRRLVALTATFGGMYTVINSFKNALDMGGRLNDLSSATGESAGNLSILERAFANAGVGADRVGQTISKMQAFIGNLGRGMKSAQDAAAILGVSFEELRGKTPLEQMRLLAAGLNRIQDAGTAADASMLIFGTRAGGKVTTLLKNFEGEVANARQELGSLPAILDKTNQSLDELGDKLTNSIGNKLNEFAVGALAGAQGANDLANALSKIDAAGAGLTVGNLARFVATNPLKALEALGNTLLSVGATIANEIAAQVMAAFKGLVNVIVSGDFWSGVGNVVQGALLQAARAFEFAIVDAIAKALEAASRIPVAGKMFEGLGEAARQEADKAADAYRAASEQMRQGMSQAGGAFMDAGRGVYNRQDLFGEAFYAGQAVQNYAEAMQTASEQSAKATDSEKSFADSVREANAELAKRNQMLGNKFSPATQLTSAGLTNKLNSSFSRTGTIDPAIQAMWSMPKMTDKEYNERARKLKEANLSHRAYGDALDALNSERLNRGRGGPFVDPKFRNMVNDATLTESERRRAEANARAATMDPATQADKIATETTLQKVANFLEQLNTKLPQPVLV